MTHPVDCLFVRSADESLISSGALDTTVLSTARGFGECSTNPLADRDATMSIPPSPQLKPSMVSVTHER